MVHRHVHFGYNKTGSFGQLRCVCVCVCVVEGGGGGGGGGNN